MNMKTRKPVLVSAAVLLVSCACLLIFALPGMEHKPLSQGQIDALRAEYPAHSGVPQTVSMNILPLDTVLDRADTLIRATVLDEAVLDALSSRTHHSFFGYTIEIINDSAGVFKKGDILTVAANEMVRDATPPLKRGMEILAPIAENPQWGKVYSFSSFGMYYITKDGYALSAYDMEEAMAKDGMKADALMKDLWGMKRQNGS
jgi:hypothetical protein